MGLLRSIWTNCNETQGNGKLFVVWKCGDLDREGEEIVFSLEPKVGEGPGRGGRNGNRHPRHLETGQGAVGPGSVYERRSDPGGRGRYRLLQRELKSSFQPESQGTPGVHELFSGDGRRQLDSGRACGKGKILYQRCFWHSPYPLKFSLFQGRVKVKRESPECLSVMARI